MKMKPETKPTPASFDFQRPVEICQWCGYPFNASSPRHIKAIDCPKHRPTYYERPKLTAEDERELDKDIERTIAFQEHGE